jgi:hypothetical protein
MGVVDRYSAEYHLTPRGWVGGSETFFEKSTKEVVPPDDRVETWLKEVEQSSRHSPEEVDWKIIWSDPNKAKDEIERLRSSFPRPFQFPKQ